MAILNVNTTRMELNKLKKRLITARKGHKLLKNKSDGLLIEFIKISKQTLKLQKEIDKDFKTANLNLKTAKVKTSKEEVMAAFSISKQKIKISTSTVNKFGVNILNFKIIKNKTNSNNILNYSFFCNSVFLDTAVEKYNVALINLVKLTEKEQAIKTMAAEIEKIRKRVNALQYILIPNLEDTIKFISLKLEENERNTIARLSKIK